MHRLVQEYVKGGQPGTSYDRRSQALLDHIRARAEFLWDGWVRHEHRWELGPLTACAGIGWSATATTGPGSPTWRPARCSELGKFASRRAPQPPRGRERTRPDDLEPRSRLNSLAALLRTTNRLAEAEPLYRRALAIDEAYGPDHPAVATALNNLAVLLQATNRLAEAEPLYRRALAIGRRATAPTIPKVATALNNLAELLRATNRLAEAEPLYRRALAIDEASYGPDHPDVAIRLNNLAVLLQATNRLAEAEPLVPPGAGDRRGVVRPRPSQRRHSPQQPGGVARATNRLAEAEPLYRRRWRSRDIVRP